MSEHACSGCGKGCGGGHAPTEPQKSVPNALSRIKKVIGVTSGKGGTGKSLVTALLATGLLRRGKQVAILDADIAGPTIPQMFHLPQSVTRGEEGFYPALSDGGLKVMSISMLTENELDIVSTRGLVMAGIAEQFWIDVVWDQVDCLLIDFPPGLEDITQFAFEQLPLEGLILVTTPQELVNQAVRRTIHMAQTNRVPVLGLVENFNNSFSGSAAEAVSREFALPILDSLPLDPRLSKAADTGGMEGLEGSYLPNTISLIEDLL